LDVGPAIDTDLTTEAMGMRKFRIPPAIDCLTDVVPGIGAVERDERRLVNN
jgi:hypothetical protein